MSAIMIADPAVEPVTLGDAKDYLRIDGTDSDDVLVRLIAAARTCVEGMTRRALVSQTWRYLAPTPKNGRIPLPATPLRHVLAVRLFGPAGRVTTLSPQDYVVSMGNPAAVHVRDVPADTTGAEIDAEIGYGPATTDVPADLRHAVLQLVAHWFERREPIVSGTFAQVPMTVSAVTAPYRALAL